MKIEIVGHKDWNHWCHDVKEALWLVRANSSENKMMLDFNHTMLTKNNSQFLLAVFFFY